MNDKQETYADRINKLLRKAESTTPEEAELLIGKAQELMTKYAIDEAMLDALRLSRGETGGNIVTEEFVMTGGFRVAYGNLCYYIMNQNDLEAVLIQDRPRTVNGKTVKQTYILKATGFKSDMDRVRMLYTSLQIQAARFQAEWWATNRSMYVGRDRAGFVDRRQFLFSFANRISERLREAKVRATTSAAKEHGSGMELVLRDKKALVTAEFNRMYPNLRSGRQRQQGGSLDSHHAGRTAADRADVGGGKLTGSGNGKKQLNS
jgi:hypothetical protein